MKYIITAILSVLAITSAAQAETYCQWDGTRAINCRGVKDNGKIKRMKLPDNGWIIVTPELAKRHGYYPVITVQPALTNDQKYDAVQQSSDGAAITWTYPVIPKTQAEIDATVCNGMGGILQGIIEHMVTVGLVTKNGQNRVFLEPAEVDPAIRAMYLACKAATP